jgi:hypothetical protein
MVGEPGIPSREELFDLYKAAVEEYRFQVKLNADRSRDYVVLNSAIIAAGITLLGQAQRPELVQLRYHPAAGSKANCQASYSQALTTRNTPCA